MAEQRNVPLVVDLDGTLIRTDLMWESLARLLRRNPFAIFQILFWWSRGRAWLKQTLAARVQINPADLPWNEQFLAWLREQKRAGGKIILATASDLKMARPVAEHAGVFDDVLASDGKTNLRGQNKLRAIIARFGERAFDYAGNSMADLPVWRGARQAIVVNASRRVQRAAANCAAVGPVFAEGYSGLATAKRVCLELFWTSGYLVALIGGLLWACAFPNISFAGGAWVAPAVLMAAASGKRGSDAFRVGYVAGLAFFLTSLGWLLLIPVTGYPILGWAALAAYLALFPALWVWLVAASWTRMAERGPWTGRTLWSLGGAATWVALEMVQARLWSGFPWDPLGASQYQLIPLIQIASVTGVYGVSFLVVWLSLALYSAWRMIFRQPGSRFAWQAETFLPLAVVAVVYAVGFARLNGQPEGTATLRITLVQPSIPQSLIWDPAAGSNRFRQLLELSENALTNRTDLLIWPESAVPEFDLASYAAITNLTGTRRVWLIFNADDAAPRADAKSRNDLDYFNAAFLFGPDGRFRNVYHKQNLVIFGEYIPLVRWLPFVKWFTPITGGFAAGTNAVPFELEMERGSPDRPEATETARPAEPMSGAPSRAVTSTLICFEDVFPHLARAYVRDDTDFLVNLTSDAWFGEGAAQWQQAVTAVFRAVENGVPLVRCCNNGLTCWADATGRLRQIFKDAAGTIYGPGAMTIDVPVGVKRHPTFYNRHGDWFGWSCVAWAAGLAVYSLVLGRKRSPQ
ncbi:MAG TPA: apolipoprotein N-acyltransferase [Candidatus Acidoferrum sp.]|nr:apolipoprotein N-acyltransferase [Candidatus Acidoferrum sp.]